MIFYHTHVPVFLDNGGLKAPRFFANEVNAMVSRGEEIYLLVYSAIGKEIEECRSVIDSKVRFYLISEHYSVPKRLFFGLLHIFSIWKLINSYDKSIVLIKGPTPLLLVLFPIQYTHDMYLYLVGDYTQNISALHFGTIKNSGIKILAHLVDWFIKTRYKKASLLVNSQLLLNKYSKYFIRSKLVKTSTIFKRDIVLNRNYSNKKLVILFVGRVDYSKGVDELVKGFKLCYESGIASRLEIVGPIVKNGLDVKTRIEFEYANESFMSCVKFVGPVFDENALKEKYLSSDVFVLPSKSEGFPRVFWEAFSAGVPVISTKVGGIPFILTDRHDALLMRKGDAKEIFESILLLFEDRDLFKALVINAQKLAVINTIDNQVDNMLNYFYEK